VTLTNVTATRDIPYTLLVRNGDLTIEGDADANALYIVPDGKIIFRNKNCDHRDIVK